MVKTGVVRGVESRHGGVPVEVESPLGRRRGIDQRWRLCHRDGSYRYLQFDFQDFAHLPKTRELEGQRSIFHIAFSLALSGYCPQLLLMLKRVFKVGRKLLMV